ncbi:MAG: hypothetical protein CMJ47_06145 [Planctomyces sp.]|nr:hypothetical protein [Planctomyces sp.]
MTVSFSLQSLDYKITVQFFSSVEEHNPLATEAEEIEALLDLVLDSALAELLQFSELPARIPANDVYTDLVITRKMMQPRCFVGWGIPVLNKLVTVGKSGTL